MYIMSQARPQRPNAEPGWHGSALSAARRLARRYGVGHVVLATDSASVRGASSATTLDAASSACGTALTDGADTNLSDVSGSALEASMLASSTTLSQSRKVACAGLPATPRSTRRMRRHRRWRARRADSWRRTRGPWRRAASRRPSPRG